MNSEGKCCGSDGQKKLENRRPKGDYIQISEWSLGYLRTPSSKKGIGVKNIFVIDENKGRYFGFEIFMFPEESQ